MSSTFSTKLPRLSRTLSTGTIRLPAATLQLALCVPTVAVTTASPSASAVTVPSCTCTTPSGAALHCTLRSVVSSGQKRTSSALLCPIFNSMLSGCTSSLRSGTAAVVTCTAQAAYLAPALAVISAVPFCTAVTLPSRTSATPSGCTIQCTVLSVAFSGQIRAVSTALSPAFICSATRSSRMRSTGTVSG